MVLANKKKASNKKWIYKMLLFTHMKINNAIGINEKQLINIKNNVVVRNFGRIKYWIINSINEKLKINISVIKIFFLYNILFVISINIKDVIIEHIIINPLIIRVRFILFFGIS